MFKARVLFFIYSNSFGLFFSSYVYFLNFLVICFICLTTKRGRLITYLYGRFFLNLLFALENKRASLNMFFWSCLKPKNVSLVILVVVSLQNTNTKQNLLVDFLAIDNFVYCMLNL